VGRTATVSDCGNGNDDEKAESDDEKNDDEVSERGDAGGETLSAREE
jgi:hypothetical protein